MFSGKNYLTQLEGILIAEKINVLGVSYGARTVAMLDAILKSPGYEPTFFIYDKQWNPYNAMLVNQTGGEHTVGDLKDVEKIVNFAKGKGPIAFAIAGSEDPAIAGLRNELKKIGITALCPAKELAIEASKVRQREIIAKVCPEANPDYRVFYVKDYKSKEDPDLKKDFMDWYGKMNGLVAIKPDLPGYGAGVVVAGDHFKPENEDAAFGFFLKNFEKGDVIVEEAFDCEEFSGQYWSDGKIIVQCPFTRDFKRRFDGDRGNNTGGMATLKGYGELLPFMTEKDAKLAWDYASRIFNELKGPDFVGMPMYIAFAITNKGLKILEINSRPGDPEILTVLPLIKMPFAEVCMRMREGGLVQFEHDPKSGLLLYKVPPEYGGGEGKLEDRLVELEDAYSFRDNINELHGEDRSLIYPGSMELVDGETRALGSRTVASIGFSHYWERAGRIAEAGLEKIKDGGLEHRRDPLSVEYWDGVIKHADRLRAQARA